MTLQRSQSWMMRRVVLAAAAVYAGVIANCASVPPSLVVPPTCAVQDDAPSVRPPSPFIPTASYDAKEMRGWTVRVSPTFENEDPDLLIDVLALLDDHLFRITRVIPPPALGLLQDVPIWVDVTTSWTKCMCYHVSKGWLIPNGYNPDKEKSVEIGNARAFLSWTHQQPWMVLHELAHAYHDLHLGYDNTHVHEAWKAVVADGVYDDVLRIRGGRGRHYALTNDREYFAETTEAIFGTNDFYPFVKGELLEADPEGAALVEQFWRHPLKAPPESRTSE